MSLVMNVDRLSKEELVYELRIRGLETSGVVNTLRKLFRAALATEKATTNIVRPSNPFTFAEDQTAIELSLTTIEESIKTLSQTSLPSQVQKIKTQLCHILGRIDNSVPSEVGDSEIKENFLTRFATLMLSFELACKRYKFSSTDKSELLEDNPDDIEPSAPVSPQITPANVILPTNPFHNCNFNYAAVSKWNVQFSGDRSQSLNAFLERVKELKRARGVTDEQIFNEACELFTDKALIWFRSIRDFVFSWDGLVQALKKEFLPINYDEKLLNEIKARTQGQSESIGIYVATIRNMFARLNNQLSEEHQLRILLRNILPFYQTQLGLINVSSIPELIRLGKIIEEKREFVENFVPPSCKTSTLEPDLAYLQPKLQVDSLQDHPVASTSRSTRLSNKPRAIPSRIVCWNCDQSGHIAADCTKERTCYFCYRCGKKNFTIRTCPDCAKFKNPENLRNRDDGRFSSRTFVNSTLQPVYQLLMDRDTVFKKNKPLLDYVLDQNKGDERPYVTVEILGCRIPALLDSGANRTVLGHVGWTMLSSLDLILNKRLNPSCRVANNAILPTLGTLSVPIKLCQREIVLDILVAPELSHTLILGVDFWRSIGIVPDLFKGEFNFSNPDLINLNAISTPALQSRFDLDSDQCTQLNHIIETYFPTNSDVLGCAKSVKHSIVTTSPPIKQRYYPVSPAVQAQIDKELDKMLTLGVIEKSKSAWSNPILLVKKKDNSYRFCVDFRKLNKVTERDAYPLPYVSSILDRLRDARFITSLDIKSAYWQIELEESSKQYTSFTIPNRGLFQFKRLPFGLHNAPATWQRLIDTVLGPELEPYVFVYLDDVIICTSTFEKHLEILDQVLSRLKDEGLTLGKDKCHFCKSELKYLGYVVNAQGLLVDPDKVSAILQISTPTNASEVRRIVGMASWYRRFIPNFSTLIAPLCNLFKKNKKFLWTDLCEIAFDSIKSHLVSAPVLACPNFELPFTVQTDASNFGLGAILTQNIDDKEHVICYLSKSLTKNERNFSVTERECLAVIWAIEKLRPYLEGSKFTVITDHHSLIWLNNLKEPTGRLARWAVRLQQYDFEIIHRKGKDNVVPDALSRSVPILDVVTANESSVPIINSRTDRWYDKMLSRVRSEPLKFPKWRIVNNRLFKLLPCEYPDLHEDSDNWKQVVPKFERLDILKQSHDEPTSGHFGIFKTFQRICKTYYWPKLRADVTAYVNKCKICLSHKPEQKKPAGLMSRHPIVTKPWQMIATDLVGPLPKSSHGYRFILVVVDYFTKFPLLFPLRAATANAVTKIIEEQVFLLFGVPQFILCDNGVQYKSKEFQRMVSSYFSKIIYNANYHPQANPSERINRILKTMLSSYVADNHKTWDRFLPKVACAIRTAVHEVTGMTPYFANFAREMSLNHNSRSPPSSDTDLSQVQFADRQILRNKSHPLAKVHQDIVDRLETAYQKNKTQYDLRHRDVRYAVGDFVWKRNFVLSDATKNFNAKLAPKFIGPFTIKRVVSYAMYELIDDQGVSKGVWHTKDLKPHSASLE